MEHLRNLVELFTDKHPTLRAREEHFEHIETVLLPHLLRVIQRDNTLFSEIELFPGIKVEWTGTDETWKKLHVALVYSVLHGDPKEKFGKIFETFKGFVPGNEFADIFEKEGTQSAMSEIFELIMNTRLVSLVGDVMQSVSLDELDLTDPEKLMEMMRNPQDSPVLTKIMERVKSVMETKVKNGTLNPNEVRRDIETIRAKCQESFGKYMNEAVLGEAGGNKSGNTAKEILSNHPDARRARMLARLQKKQQEKSNGKK